MNHFGDFLKRASTKPAGPVRSDEEGVVELKLLAEALFVSVNQGPDDVVGRLPVMVPVHQYPCCYCSRRDQIWMTTPGVYSNQYTPGVGSLNSAITCYRERLHVDNSLPNIGEILLAITFAGSRP